MSRWDLALAVVHSWQFLTLLDKNLLVMYEIMYRPPPYRYHQLSYHRYLLRGMSEFPPIKGLKSYSIR